MAAEVALYHTTTYRGPALKRIKTRPCGTSEAKRCSILQVFHRYFPGILCTRVHEVHITGIREYYIEKNTS